MSVRVLTVLAGLLWCASLSAQQPGLSTEIGHEHKHGWITHYGKWVAFAFAGAFTALGAHEHENSNKAFDQLASVCRANNSACAIGPNGAYLNATAERMYQASLHYDSRARVRLIAGQLGLLVAGGLFLADLHHGDEPENIPFTPPAELLLEPKADGARVGVQVHF